MLRSGSADPRESGVGLRYNNPKAEGVRAGDNWLPLLGGTATGASARGEHSNDFSYGVIGGLPVAPRRRRSQQRPALGRGARIGKGAKKSREERAKEKISEAKEKQRATKQGKRRTRRRKRGDDAEAAQGAGWLRDL